MFVDVFVSVVGRSNVSVSGQKPWRVRATTVVVGRRRAVGVGIQFRGPFKTFKPFNRCAPFKTPEPDLGSRFNDETDTILWRLGVGKIEQVELCLKVRR